MFNASSCSLSIKELCYYSHSGSKPTNSYQPKYAQQESSPGSHTDKCFGQKETPSSQLIGQHGSRGPTRPQRGGGVIPQWVRKAEAEEYLASPTGSFCCENLPWVVSRGV